MDYAVVTSRQCFLYEDEGKTSVSDELLSGWAVTADFNMQPVVHVTAHNGYSGYADTACLRKTDYIDIAKRQSPQYMRIGGQAVDVLAKPKYNSEIRDTLLKNSIVCSIIDIEDIGWSYVRTAAGICGYVPTVSLEPRLDDDSYLLNGCFTHRTSYRKKCDEAILRRCLVKSALAYLGVRYRWGGKTVMGIDCSGLVCMAYMEQGILIYRDARIEEGYPVHYINRCNIKRGDLIYFPGHVAMYIGNDRYIHSTGNRKSAGVTINSLNPCHKDYREDLAQDILYCGSVFC